MTETKIKGLRLEEDDRGRSCPRLYCGICGDRIKDGKSGHVLYLDRDSDSDKQIGFMFVHKACDNNCGGDKMSKGGWDHLDQFLVHLMAGLGIDHDDMAKSWDSAYMMSQFG
jgi:hypothetical protein